MPRGSALYGSSGGRAYASDLLGEAPEQLDDFARFGFRGSDLSATRRAWILTLDFEAFTVESAPLWHEAMHQWAARCREGGWMFSFFTSVEHVVRLRVADSGLYEEFLEAARALHSAGVEYHPHNHCLFDPATGERATPRAERERPVHGYPKRPSMYYDLAYRNGSTFRAWLPSLLRAYDEFLHDARIARPPSLAFRAGGWDYGSTKADVSDYLQGLVAGGFAFESGAVAGVRGTRSWRIGAPFGSNTYKLLAPLIEVAPTDAMNCGATIGSIPFYGWISRILRQPRLWALPFRAGVLVTVLHFDELFHVGHGSSTHKFAVDDRREVARRIDAFFRRIDRARRLLHLEPCTFAELRQILQDPATSSHPTTPM
jgi:hypothetical protein